MILKPHYVMFLLSQRRTNYSDGCVNAYKGITMCP